MVPFFHYPGVDYPRFSVPLLFPSIAALVGASFPCRSCLYVAIATLVLAYWISGKIKPCKYFSPRAFLLTLLAFILGTTKGLSWNNTIQTIHNIVDGKVVPVEVLVLNTPSDSEYYTSFKGMVRGGSEQYKVMVQAALYRQGEIRTGNVVKVEGKFHIPRHPLNPGEFNYPRYLAGQKIFVELKGTVKHVSDDARLCLRSTAAQVREYICSRIDFLIPPPEASVMKAILVGERVAFQRELAVIAKVWICSILSATGFHVGILGYLVYRTWKKISKGEKVPE